MIDGTEFAFLDLLSRRFERAGASDLLGEARDRFASESSEADFDLALWSLAQAVGTDTEELMRQAGELWFEENARSGRFLSRWSEEVLGYFEAIVVGESVLSEAPVPGMSEFKVTLLSRREESIRLQCEGARRCCSFLEGIARGVGGEMGKSVRYLRRPKRARSVELSISCF
ncbi:hypothetical protein [Pelagicoccus sp. SDUM812003]|uniref:hypothetical protein n=1 Tax=Pelagicoccus sp. SDUM812003 TaxID=3041267 RepID=UPI00280C8A39|nr:hypothetical protein [Pelagicoccus sp. SDUM812003]MDQ8204258.1 hypothetical protein [Pelagicoccus sp. SDUM812003]